MAVTVGRGSRRHAWLSSPEHAERSARLAVVPCGAVEQHGPHLPVGTDAWIAEAVATAATAGRDDTVVAEPIGYGCSAHHTGFAGTVTLRVPTFMAVVADVATSLARDGYVPVFFNGHGGNRGPLTAALQQLLDDGVAAWAVSYFDLIGADVAASLPGHHDSVGHACALETSLVMHLWPGAVHTDRVPAAGGAGRWPDPYLYSADPVTRPRRFGELSPTGVVGKPERAGAALGESLFEAAVRRAGEFLDRVAAETAEPAPAAETAEGGARAWR